MKTKHIIPLSLMLLLASCGSKEEDFDATGTFEATETTVSAQQSGQLLQLDIREGDAISAGKEAGLIDTVPLMLKMKQVIASKNTYGSQRPNMQTQLAVTRQRLEKARQELRRFRELVRDGAAPRKQLDDAESAVSVLERQLSAQRSRLQTSNKTINSQMATADTQIKELENQLEKCHVVSPVTGTILEKYAQEGEFVSTGKPLFKVADTQSMFLRAYVTSNQLVNVKVGQRVKVISDYGDNTTKSYEGVVSWISPKSEFTPKTILTDDERADLVYAVKIAVRNDGYLKIGMYGKVEF